MSPSTPAHLRVAEVVHVERVGRSFRLEIDGELFPYALSGDEPIETSMEAANMASLRFTLLAERVEFVDQPFPDGAADV